MAVQTEIDICNAALSLLGEPHINAFDQTGEAERQCELLYSMSRDAVLRAHPWNFAEKYAQLTQLTETPPFEYAYYYQLPADCIRALRLVDTKEDWRIMEGRKLATDERPAYLVYTSQVNNPALFDPAFVQALIYHLAAQMAISLPNKANLQVQLMQQYESIIRQAKSLDGQEGTPIALKYKSDWKFARRNYNPLWPWRS